MYMYSTVRVGGRGRGMRERVCECVSVRRGGREVSQRRSLNLSSRLERVLICARRKHGLISLHLISSHLMSVSCISAQHSACPQQPGGRTSLWTGQHRTGRDSTGRGRRQEVRLRGKTLTHAYTASTHSSLLYCTVDAHTSSEPCSVQ